MLSSYTFLCMHNVLVCKSGQSDQDCKITVGCDCGGWCWFVPVNKTGVAAGLYRKLRWLNISCVQNKLYLAQRRLILRVFTAPLLKQKRHFACLSSMSGVTDLFDASVWISQFYFYDSKCVAPQKEFSETFLYRFIRPLSFSFEYQRKYLKWKNDIDHGKKLSF